MGNWTVLCRWARLCVELKQLKTLGTLRINHKINHYNFFCQLLSKGGGYRISFCQFGVGFDVATYLSTCFGGQLPTTSI